MTLKLPKGADLLTDIRRQGFRPSRPVFVYLDADRPRQRIYFDMPLDIEICIRPSDLIRDLDFRSLTGLSIAVSAPRSGERLRDLLAAIRRAAPQFIGGAIHSENTIFAWHPQRGWERCYVQ